MYLADYRMVLLRSLPEKCQSHCLLRGNSESFEDLKRVALKFKKGNKGCDVKPLAQSFLLGSQQGKGRRRKRKRQRRNRKASVSPAKMLEDEVKARTRKTWCYVCHGKKHYARVLVQQ